MFSADQLIWSAIAQLELEGKLSLPDNGYRIMIGSRIKDYNYIIEIKRVSKSEFKRKSTIHEDEIC